MAYCTQEAHDAARPIPQRKLGRDFLGDAAPSRNFAGHDADFCFTYTAREALLCLIDARR